VADGAPPSGELDGPRVDVSLEARRLDTLVIKDDVVVKTKAPQGLRRLEIRSPYYDLAMLKGFAAPDLEELVMWATRPGDLALLARFPKLRRLGLCGTDDTDTIAKQLAKVKLERVDLSGGTLTAAARRTLAKKMKVIAGRARIDPTATLDARWQTAARRPAAHRRTSLARLVREYDDAVLGSLGGVRYFMIGQLCDEQGDFFEAEAWLWQAARDARWAGNERTEHAALAQIGTLRMRRGDAATAAPLLAKVGDAFRGKNKSQEAWALRQQGNVELVRSNFVKAEELYRKSLALYTELGDKQSQAIVMSELSSAYWSRSDYDGAEKLLREAIALKDPGSVGLGSTYYNLGAILNGANRVKEAIAAANQALAIFNDHAHRQGQGQASSLLGELHQRINDHATATRLIDEAIACFREQGLSRELGVALGNASRVALDLGDWARARACCEEAVELHRDVGNKYNEGMQLMGLGDAAIGERDFAAADEHLTASLVPMRAIKNYPCMSAAKLRLGMSAPLRGDHVAARRHYDESIADARKGNYLELEGWTDIWVAILHAQAKKSADAKRSLAHARELIPAESVQGAEALAMAEAVIARLGGSRKALPEPKSWDARILATVAP
jgi:tetratricopeptide (TPR) repeat protein